MTGSRNSSAEATGSVALAQQLRKSDRERGARPVRIANCSGFYGDRLSAAREMVEGGPIDVLTGDWLAELTMLILWKARARNAEAGYATTFLTQMEQVLGTCVDRGIRVVTNAGGLNPAGCADQVRAIADRLGLAVDVAHIEGDDLLDRIDGLRPQLTHLDTGAPLDGRPAQRQRLPRRVGHRPRPGRGRRRRRLPARHRRRPGRRPGGVVVGLGADRLGPARRRRRRRPRHRVRAAGDRRQLRLLRRARREAARPAARLPPRRGRRRRLGGHHEAPGHGRAGDRRDRHRPAALRDRRARLPQPGRRRPVRHHRVSTQAGPDRVRISGTRGEPAPSTTKVAINYDGGFRNRMTFVLTGLDQAAKAAWIERLAALRRSATAVELETPLRAGARPTGPTRSGPAGCSTCSPGRATSGPSAGPSPAPPWSWPWPASPASSRRPPPGGAQAFGVYWPALVPVEESPGRRHRRRPPPAHRRRARPVRRPTRRSSRRRRRRSPRWPSRRAPRWAATSAPAPATRAATPTSASGPRDDAGYAWLAAELTAARVGQLLPEAAGRPITPN